MKGIIKSLAVVVALVFVAACGEVQFGDNGGGGSAGGGKKDLSKIGLTPQQNWHPQYLVGAHARFSCDNCHASGASKDKICANCHMGNYNATSTPNHSSYNIPTYCNSCHFSDSFTRKNRVSHTKFHSEIKKSCAKCHSDRKPASHGATRSSGCESCHQYPSWSATTGFNHSGITSGCNTAGCHVYHYTGYDCSWCHTSASPGNYWGAWRHNSTDGRACTACHSGGYDDDDDDYDDD